MLRRFVDALERLVHEVNICLLYEGSREEYTLLLAP